MVPLTVAILLAGCGGADEPAPGSTAASDQAADLSGVAVTDDDGAEVAPTWTGDDAPEGTVSFADGPALAAVTDLTFSNGLADVWDWELVGEPDSTTTGASPPLTLEMVNTGNGCRVLDERAPYEGTSTDDGAASTALVEDRLADAEILADPSQGLLGIGEGLGEDGPTYNVAEALARETDGQWVLVTARAFVALGAQQIVTVRCESGEDIDRTRGQLAMVSFANLRGLERYP